MFKKLANSVFIKKIMNVMRKCYRRFLDMIKCIPYKIIFHMNNCLALVISYGLVSLLVYPEFKFCIFFKEIFSLLCAYGAIFLWFMDTIDMEVPFRVAAAVTACISPILFINSSFVVALISLLLIVFCEFIFFEYLRGCNLFSNLVPVYMVCENENDAEYARKFSNDYKILELIMLSNQRNGKYSSLKSIDDIENWLKKINRMPFYPFPRRMMYFSRNVNTINFIKLLEVSSDCSIPLFKITHNASNKNIQSKLLSVSPVSFRDFETVAVSSSDKAALSSVFKCKRVWVCYDGRGSVLDLIYILSSITSVDLTIFCESEKLMIDAEQELANKDSGKDYKIKIIDINLLNLQGTKPDVLFYNMPIKSFHSGEENLKEAVVRNVLDTKRLIDFAQSNKVPFIFILSSTGALNANNWIGTTQRLGEILVQFADSQSKKTCTRFSIIRIPEGATDQLSIFGKIISSIFSNGYVSVDIPDSELATMYYRNEILPYFLKIIVYIMKNQDTTSSVYTIIPKNGIVFEDLVKNICNTLCLRVNKDVQIIYNCKSESMNLDNFINITESLEKTTIANVFRTKFICNCATNYEIVWTIDEINRMTTRELISAVFQSLNEKIKS